MLTESAAMTETQVFNCWMPAYFLSDYELSARKTEEEWLWRFSFPILLKM